MTEVTNTTVLTVLGFSGDDKKRVLRYMKSATEKAIMFSGRNVKVMAALLYREEHEDSKDDKTILILDTDNGMIGTISPTFIKSFKQIAAVMGDEMPIDLEIMSGVSKRTSKEFVDCNIAL